MITATIFSISSLILAMSASIPTATADTAEATCQLRKGGETAAGASSPCIFRQRQRQQPGPVGIAGRGGYAAGPA